MHKKTWNFIWKWFAIKPNENMIPVLKLLSSAMEKKKREHDGNIQFIFETSINRPVSVQFKVHNKDINSKPFKF